MTIEQIEKGLVLNLTLAQLVSISCIQELKSFRTVGKITDLLPDGIDEATYVQLLKIVIESMEFKLDKHITPIINDANTKIMANKELFSNGLMTVFELTQRQVADLINTINDVKNLITEHTLNI